MWHDILMAGAVFVLVIPWSLVIATGYLIKYGPNPPAGRKHRD